MKKQLALTLVVLIATLSSFGQVVNKGEHYASAFVGVGGNYSDASNYGLLIPPVGVQYEVIVTDQVGIGHIGVGGIGMYSLQNYKYTLLNSSYHYITIGAKGLYHFDLNEFMDEAIFNQLDVYAGLSLLMRYRIETSTTDGHPIENTLTPMTELTIGGRYFFSESMAVLAELGFNMTYLNVGITMKLNK